MGYEIFFGILEFHSAPVPGIITDQSLRSIKIDYSNRNLVPILIDQYPFGTTPHVDVMLKVYIQISKLVILKFLSNDFSRKAGKIELIVINTLGPFRYILLGH